MKSILLSFLLFPVLTFASDTNSTPTPEHAVLLKNAVYETCGVGSLKLVSHTAEQKVVDQGIIDVAYVTKIQLTTKISKSVVTVLSTYHDIYDHEKKEWGTILIDSVVCSDSN